LEKSNKNQNRHCADRSAHLAVSISAALPHAMRMSSHRSALPPVARTGVLGCTQATLMPSKLELATPLNLIPCTPSCYWCTPTQPRHREKHAIRDFPAISEQCRHRHPHQFDASGEPNSFRYLPIGFGYTELDLTLSSSVQVATTPTVRSAATPPLLPPPTTPSSLAPYGTCPEPRHPQHGLPVPSSRQWRRQPGASPPAVPTRSGQCTGRRCGHSLSSFGMGSRGGIRPKHRARQWPGQAVRPSSGRPAG
jgi:hypothetical protein